jgi:predicted RNase H-like nuclease (RuvC/YqgF family)
MENQRPEQKNDSKNNRTLILIILIALLVGVNIFLYVKYTQKETQTIALTEALNIDSMRIVDLNAKYSTALEELSSLRGQNQSLDSLLDIKEAEIKKMKASLDNALKNKKISDTEYKKQVEMLQSLISDLKNQISALEKEKGILIEQKEELGKQLNNTLDENGQLKQQNKVLAKKATIGALLKAQNLKATGVFGRGKKKKEIETKSSKKTESIRVCFDVDENKISDPGTKEFLLRIVSPEGVTLAVQSQGSGVFELAESGEKSQFTMKQEINYEQKKKNVCMYWEGAAGGFAKGKYTIEVYQDGYNIGSSALELK